MKVGITDMYPRASKRNKLRNFLLDTEYAIKQQDMGRVLMISSHT